jgi:hypothetical protein
MGIEVIYGADQIDWNAPGKRHYDVAFHLDSSWGYSLVPLTVINGLRRPPGNVQVPGVAVFGGTHGNEWEGQIAAKRLLPRPRCRSDLRPRYPRAPTERERLFGK